MKKPALVPKAKPALAPIKRTALRSKTRATGRERNYSTVDVELIEELARMEARESFWAFRQYMRPNMKKGWWQREVALELQQFYDDLVAGKAPILVLEAPPQHGKSEQVVDFYNWLAGKQPNLATIYASFSERLGVRANLRTQRMMDGPKYRTLFPDTRLNTSNVVTVSGQHLRNREILEFVGTEKGSFRNTTVKGPITGEGLDLGIIDDPIKGRAEANSLTNRDAVWDWFLDDFYTRFSEQAGLLIILTRWHIDDPVGRLIEEFGDRVKVLRYPAIAEKDEYSPLDGRFLRKKGEPLFPEHKSLDFLMKRKKVMALSSWEAIYQQNPIVKGGDLFPVELMTTVARIPAGCKIVKEVRYWDKAGTEQGQGAYTAGVHMALLSDDRIIVLDVKRGRWNYDLRERTIMSTAEDDGASVKVWVEQEPGSGGKESAQRTVKALHLAQRSAGQDKVTGDKITRAEPWGGYVQGGNVILLNGAWNKAYKDEHEYFPNGPFKDQVDASSGAFAKLTEPAGKKAGKLW